jgi:hypothetical protein
MRDYSREYTRFQVDAVYMEPNEVFTFNAGCNNRWISSFVFQGDCTRVQNGADLPAWGVGFQNDPVEYKQDEATYTAGPDGVAWVCVECRKGTGTIADVETAHVNVAGDYTLPAGWGFVVAQGEVTADGKTATQSLYFAPRDADVVVSGSADLLLLK